MNNQSELGLVLPLFTCPFIRKAVDRNLEKYLFIPQHFP